MRFRKSTPQREVFDPHPAVNFSQVCTSVAESYELKGDYEWATAMRKLGFNLLVAYKAGEFNKLTANETMTKFAAVIFDSAVAVAELHPECADKMTVLAGSVEAVGVEELLAPTL
ncbi:MAG: hypothetical protein JWS12_919 [Candidatus Saccharibacteria bacterium]|nr:hypothetical protein [Candidatus Saccharibacteria bacterium]